VASRTIYTCDVCREEIPDAEVCRLEVSMPAYSVSRDVHEACLVRVFATGGEPELLAYDKAQGT